jgi:MFS transporter, MHS family, proline/betaine transporter
VLYLIGCITALFGLFLRGKLLSNHVTLKSNNSFKTLFNDLWKWRREALLVAMAAGFSYSSYSIALVLMNGFIPLVTEISKAEMVRLNTILLVIDFIALPFFGLLATRFSRYKMMVMASALALVSGIPLFMLVNKADLITVIVVRISLVIIGVWFSATFHSWSQNLLPLSQRYSVISFAYALGSQLLGGPTVVISLWLFQKTGMISSACWYWMALGGITAVWIAKTSRINSLAPNANVQ